MENKTAIPSNARVSLARSLSIFFFGALGFCLALASAGSKPLDTLAALCQDNVLSQWVIAWIILLSVSSISHESALPIGRFKFRTLHFILILTSILAARENIPLLSFLLVLVSIIWRWAWYQAGISLAILAAIRTAAVLENFTPRPFFLITIIGLAASYFCMHTSLVWLVQSKIRSKEDEDSLKQMRPKNR